MPHTARKSGKGYAIVNRKTGKTVGHFEQQGEGEELGPCPRRSRPRMEAEQAQVTDTELAVVRAAVDLVEHWSMHDDHVNGPHLTDLEHKLTEAVIAYGAEP